MLNIDPATMLRLISTGFWSSRGLSTAVELDLFLKMGDGEWLPEDLANELNVSARGLEVLLRFLQLAGLVACQRDGKFAVTDVSRRFLNPQERHYLGYEATI